MKVSNYWKMGNQKKCRQNVGKMVFIHWCASNSSYETTSKYLFGAEGGI
jgi:hypothetical protein